MKSVGILGGMGPEATNYFYRLILEHTPAKIDQDHIPTIIISDPTIPDRTSAIFSGDTTVVLARFTEIAKRLEKAGASFITIPCNTAHFWIDSLQANVNIPVLDMLALTAKYLSDNIIKKVGLMSTLATVKTELYQNALSKFGVECVIPNEDDKQLVMDIILRTKASANRATDKQDLLTISLKLKDLACERVILGCTELPLLVPQDDFILDPMVVMAKGSVARILSC